MRAKQNSRSLQIIHHSSFITHHSSSRRRGVLLLVVLALLAIFALVGVAFVVMTSQAQRSAKPIQRIEQGVDLSQPGPARMLLQQAMMQVLHGSNGATSVAGAHSLLEEMYGSNWVRGTVNAAASNGLPQLIDIIPGNTLEANTVAGSLTTITTISGTTSVAVEMARRGGCVLTITNQYTNNDPSRPNPCYGQSTRIVGIAPGATNFQVMAFPDGSLPQPNDTFVINGAAFSGTGFGFDATGNPLPSVTAGTLTGCQVALLPNNITYNRNPPGGADSDYTAPDFQHMFLGAQIANGAAIRTLPSMHRPALCRYWLGRSDPAVTAVTFDTVQAMGSATQAMSADLKRAIIMRPLPEDHPDFTGSNPAYAGTSTTDYSSGFNPCWDGVSTYGQPTSPFSWDVDNDGDGIPDSVWIDLGLPVQTTSDGRLYKPLFAILCVDLDGRLNLNAHGSLAQVAMGALVSPTGGTATDNGFRGLGLGPAEIRLDAFLGTNYQQVLTGGTVSVVTGGTTTLKPYEGRYGAWGKPGSSNLDPIFANRWFEYAGQSNGPTNKYWWSFLNNPAGYIPDSYGSPPDLFGAGNVTLDSFGRPVFKCTAIADCGFGSSINNSPYQTNLGPDAVRGLASSSGTQNNLFSPSELERLLRPYDRDALTLSGRLADLAGLTGTSNQILKGRLDVTTDSWDWSGQTTPAVNSSVASALKTRVTELLKARVMAGTGATAVSSQADALQMISAVLPPELFVGLKMDINRPFGNGRDYDVRPADDTTTSGIVDAPIKPRFPKQVMLAGTTSVPVNVPVNYAGTGTTQFSNANNSLLARQAEARYLYVLVFTLADRAKLAQAFGNDYEKTARAVAQWAVNAVDFRDRDNIMTPFDYDPNYAYPDGYNDPTTGVTHPLFNSATHSIWYSPPGGKYRVWGCERPALLISETLALHDRRTEDTADEYSVESGDNDSQKSAGTTQETDPDKKDGSFDQSYRPQGSLFVEFYNPASPYEPQCKDLYSYSATTGKWGLSLAQLSGTATSAPGGGKPSPVWRLLVAIKGKGAAGGSGAVNGGAPEDTLLDPDDPDPDKRPTFEREVYFRPLNPLTMKVPDKLPGVKVQFFPSTLPANVNVPPGGYAVIGSGDPHANYQNGYPNRTYIGFRRDGSGTGNNSTRYVDLTSPSSTTSGTATLPVQNNPSQTDPTTTVDTPVMLPINSPWRLSVSEPYLLSGTVTTSVYDIYELKAAGMVEQDPNSGRYVKNDHITPTAFDLPFDQPRAGDDSDTAALKAKLKTNHTEPAFRMIYLQRLANPLKPYNNNAADQNGDYNPYLTIDSMAVDLTVFNGVTDKTDPYTGPDVAANTHFEARQRGENNDEVAGGLNTNMNLWKQEPVEKDFSRSTPAPPIQDHYFSAGLKHSLGYLNQPFGTPQMTTTEKGLPARPFPWLTWNNRPYVSPLELMLVPALSSSKLLSNASSGLQAADPKNNDYCQGYNFIHAGNSATVAPYSATGLTGPAVPYPHLLDFFQSGTGAAAELHRVFDYLTVPSPFVGTDVWANPTSAQNGTHAYHPPFSRISTYREPGRINLNTIYDQDVFNGLMASGTSSTSTTTLWADFWQSRRGVGSGGTASGVLEMPPIDSPTEFAHPFRSFAGASMVPTLPGTNPLKFRREIDATLLRASGTASTAQPLLDFASSNPADNSERNPYFRYQRLQRLENLVTTRSNVFAVWITVGYFEVSPAPSLTNNPRQHDDAGHTPWTAADYQAVYPDGYQFGRELGIDTGEVSRHRAFYIIDRTLPVGFQRGQDLNSDKAILLNRFIE